MAEGFAQLHHHSHIFFPSSQYIFIVIFMSALTTLQLWVVCFYAFISCAINCRQRLPTLHSAGWGGSTLHFPSAPASPLCPPRTDFCTCFFTECLCGWLCAQSAFISHQGAPALEACLLPPLHVREDLLCALSLGLGPCLHRDHL